MAVNLGRRGAVVAAALAVLAAVAGCTPTDPGPDTGADPPADRRTERSVALPPVDGDGAPTDGLTATPDDPALTIDLPTATAVLEAWFPRHAKAVAAEDRDRLAELDTGAALAWLSDSCGPCSPWIGSLGDDPTFVAADASSYPASFLARLTIDTTVARDTARPRPSSQEAVVVFTRASADDPWKAALLLADTALPPSLPAPDGDTIAAAAPTEPELDPATAFDDLAAWMSAMKDTGAPPPDGPIMAPPSALADMAEIHASHEELVELGWSDVTDYRSGATEDGLFTFTADDGAVACSSVRWDTSITPVEGGPPLVQADDQERFGSYVPPGHYAEIYRRGVRQTCLLLPSGCACAVPIAFEGGVIASGGRPA